MISSKFIAAALMVLALGAWGGCQKDVEPDAGPAPGGVAVGTKAGQTAPDFRLTSLQGEPLRLSDLRGKTVLLDFWDTWCPPCRRALPHLQDLSVQYAADLVVVGVAMGQEGEARVRSFVRERGLTFPVAIAGPQVVQDYRVQSLPTTILVDRQGTVRMTWVGGYEKADYEAAIRALLQG